MGLLNDLARMVAERRFPPPVDAETEEKCPNLWEMLTMEKWGDGSERILPTIKIERVPGAYRVSLVDDSLCIRKAVIVPCLSVAFEALERVLIDPETPWETFKSYRNKKGPPVPEEKISRRKRG